jgi:hypothetical protein
MEIETQVDQLLTRVKEHCAHMADVHQNGMTPAQLDELYRTTVGLLAQAIELQTAIEDKRNAYVPKET